MGLNINALPGIGTLKPMDRCLLARELREICPRQCEMEASSMLLALKSWAIKAQINERTLIDRLEELHWIKIMDGRVNTDSFERREAAGASALPRMSLGEALKMAIELKTLLDQEYHPENNKVKLTALLLYGSTLRGEVDDSTVGDLDLALKLTPFSDNWRSVADKEGIIHQIEMGDARRTPSGEYLECIDKFWRQREGREQEPKNRSPAIMPLFLDPAMLWRCKEAWAQEQNYVNESLTRAEQLCIMWKETLSNSPRAQLFHNAIWGKEFIWSPSIAEVGSQNRVLGRTKL